MTELEKAERDARLIGRGFIVNGIRVAPHLVVIVEVAKPQREPNNLDMIIEHGRRCAEGEGW